MRIAAPSLRLTAVAVVVLLSACKRGEEVVGAPDFADLVEQVSPSVVNISTVVAEQTGDAAASLPNGESEPENLEGAPDWFKKFLEEHQGEGAEDEPPLDNTPQSLGSGFILWKDGYVVTNYHVVRDAKEVIVRLLDRRQFAAQVVGSDEASDLALLRIDAKDLPAVKLGDASKLRPGQWVLAIGSPFGFDYSVTAGIVSAKGRSLITEQYVPFIQTDVAINPGNSGGPLFNLKGEVVGVNSQIYSQSGGYQGLSFSIPIDVAAKVAGQLKEHGRVKRGWLGVVVQEVDRDLAISMKMDKPEGALVARVMPGSPAEKAGLRAGDIILSYNGIELASSTALPPMVGITDPGESAEIKLLREGKQMSLKVAVGVLQPEADHAFNEQAPGANPPGPQPAPASGALGLTVRPLTDAERRDAQLGGGGVGVMVAEARDGPAARAGVRAGDVLLQISGQEVGSPARYEEVARRLTPGQTVPLLVQRRGAPLFLALDVPAAPGKKP
ncbi:DegQ family serine endoprotease [Solimonas sp. K1W22B-7]|uniref:DegQ family serine endoprotease n=1 Tax=Solimonas sp. K1W22B-7 TaxID=2303331 RepID=UPI000E337B5D|nr:DegQ family serine endoprotease [Solimonas sp. K1W22B-7]AXQ30225.1 DegQ family serine endoprotease [Solimonas sp. K1W22B-7]